MISDCFVATAHGPIAVSDLQPNELLFSWNKQFVLKPLKSILKYPTSDILRMVSDNGVIVGATNETNIMLRSGDYCIIKELQQFDSIMAFARTKRGGEWSVSLYDELDTRVPEHIFIAGQLGMHGENIHHINGNHEDNNPENLVALTESEHREIHRQWRENKNKEITEDIKQKSISVRAESWRQWYFSLTSTKQDEYWEEIKRHAKITARKRVSEGVHNFVLNNPMLDPEKVLLNKKAQVASTAFKLKSMDLDVEEENWDESIKLSGLYKSRCFTSSYINGLFGNWNDFIAWLDTHNAKVILIEWWKFEETYELGVDNFVVCNKEMTRGVVVGN